MIRALGEMYGSAVAWRRRWYAADPSRKKHLNRPVVSIGNLRVGGTGKSPITGHVTRLLMEAGHRPAILSRGYGRRSKATTVVSNGQGGYARFEESGDEPLMLARALPGAIVVVGASRYECGLRAEGLGATVHVLDDGFQHFALARTVDLLLMDEDDLGDRPLPAGRLRERLSEASLADALLVTAGYDSAVRRVADTVGVGAAFRVSRVIGAPRVVTSGESVVVPTGARVFGVAAIARPGRFFGDLEGAGWRVVGTMAFRDHHVFTPRDVARMTRAARSAAAAIVLTTEKDAVRLNERELDDLPCAYVPLIVGIEPEDAFRSWLLEHL